MLLALCLVFVYVTMSWHYVDSKVFSKQREMQSIVSINRQSVRFCQSCLSVHHSTTLTLLIIPGRTHSEFSVIKRKKTPLTRGLRRYHSILYRLMIKLSTSHPGVTTHITNQREISEIGMWLFSKLLFLKPEFIVLVGLFANFPDKQNNFMYVCERHYNLSQLYRNHDVQAKYLFQMNICPMVKYCCSMMLQHTVLYTD